MLLPGVGVSPVEDERGAGVIRGGVGTGVSGGNVGVGHVVLPVLSGAQVAGIVVGLTTGGVLIRGAGIMAWARAYDVDARMAAANTIT